MITKLYIITLGSLLISIGCSKSDSSNQSPVTPIVTAPIISATKAVNSITSLTAISGGTITSDGGASITSRGVCWSNSAAPTTTSSKTTEGIGIGSFISSLTGLTPNTVYYLRAYAVNSIGTSYGPEISFTTFLAIGSDFMGGKLAYILTSDDPGHDPLTIHGLIAAPTDITTTMWTGAGWSFTGAISTSIGTGNANTNQLVSVYGITADYAAKRCYNLVLNSYDDWHLPSKDEMNKLYLNRVAIGGFQSSFMYWTSSEYDAQNVWVLTFWDGRQFYYSKATGAQSRAVRYF